MTDRKRLQAELFAARQELARRRIENATAIREFTDRLRYVPDRPDEFTRLTALDSGELEGHIERLKRDIATINDPEPG